MNAGCARARALVFGNGALAWYGLIDGYFFAASCGYERRDDDDATATNINYIQITPITCSAHLSVSGEGSSAWRELRVSL